MDNNTFKDISNHSEVLKENEDTSTYQYMEQPYMSITSDSDSETPTFNQDCPLAETSSQSNQPMANENIVYLEPIGTKADRSEDTPQAEKRM